MFPMAAVHTVTVAVIYNGTFVSGLRKNSDTLSRCIDYCKRICCSYGFEYDLAAVARDVKCPLSS